MQANADSSQPEDWNNQIITDNFASDADIPMSPPASTRPKKKFVVAICVMTLIMVVGAGAFMTGGPKKPTTTPDQPGSALNPIPDFAGTSSSSPATAQSPSVDVARVVPVDVAQSSASPTVVQASSSAAQPPVAASAPAARESTPQQAPNMFAATEPTKSVAASPTPKREPQQTVGQSKPLALHDASAQSAQKSEAPAELTATQSLPPAPQRTKIKGTPSLKVATTTNSKPPVPKSSKKPDVVEAAQSTKHPETVKKTQAATDTVKPMIIMSAKEAKITQFTDGSVVVSQDGQKVRYGVGDVMPAGDRVEFIDASTMTVVTDRRVIRVVN